MGSYRLPLLALLLACTLLAVGFFLNPLQAFAIPPEAERIAYPCSFVIPALNPLVAGVTVNQIRSAYGLPSGGGSGTIAIIDAYNASTVRTDLTQFNSNFGLPAANLEIVNMSSTISVNSGWALETALDVEWAHAIAPSANILLVQARTSSINDLLGGVDYARSRPDVVAISMSWGTEEFSTETFFDSHFSSSGAVFFASSGDNGAGTIWPSTSQGVVAVGGTVLSFIGGSFSSETGWSGSGGGISSFEPMPAFQSTYGVPASRRSVPDVSYSAANFPVYVSGGWTVVGGTSAGAPQWAAIQSLGLTANNANFYQDAKLSSSSSYFRDITTGNNGNPAGLGYDFVTGLGSPVTTDFTPSGTPASTITVQPAGQSTPLSPSNAFTVSYTSSGTQQTDFVQNTLTINADTGTNIIVSGASTGSTSQEKWVFGSNADSITLAAGSSTTLYYYDLLAQTANYTIAGGGSPPNPTLSYSTAPAIASGVPSSTLINLQLSQLPAQPFWALRGTTVSVTNPLIGNSSERWSTQTGTWSITSASQIPSPITYYHQYQAIITYQTIGGVSPAPPTFTATIFGITSTTTAPSTSFSTWIDASSTYLLSNPLPPSTSNERWSTTATTAGLANGAVSLSATFYHQFSVSAAYSLNGGGSPTAPDFIYMSYGNLALIQLTSLQQTFWADSGTTYSIPDQLSGSTANERWSVLANSGTIQAPTSLSLVYYHQINLSAVYSLIGGGTPTAPAFSSTNFGNPNTLTLATTLQSLWADYNSTYSAPPQLIGSTANERWFSTNNTGIIQDSTGLNITYYHQFLLNVAGVQTDSQWFNSNDTAQISVPSVFNRTSGTGQRTTGYNIDGGASNQISPTQDASTISILMNATHQIQINSVTQYQVTLDPSTSTLLASITPTSISGDNYWYDEGTPVSVVLNSIGSRAAGAGQRLTSYSVNGASTGVSTLNQVEVLNISIHSPQAVSAEVISQYQLSTPSGSVSSLTAPSFAGDTGWYDAGTAVNITFDYTWNTASQSRQNAFSYAINQSPATPLSRLNSGTFSVQVIMNNPQTITISSITQYSLSLTGGFHTALSQTSPTGDSFYDSGTTLSASSDNVWNTQSGNSRQQLSSYTLDGNSINVPRADAGTFTTAAITFNMAHTLTFNSATQYLAFFQFTDAAGTAYVTPTAFQIDVGNSGTVSIPDFSLWADSGIQLQIHSIIWQGTDVKPLGQAAYTVSGPLNETIRCRIFNATLLVLDAQGNPAVSAQVTATLANQTILNAATDANGTLSLPMIPLGTFDAIVTYSGSNATVSGDASNRAITTAVLLPSPSPLVSPEIPEVPAIAAIIALIAATFAISLTLKKKYTPKTLSP